MIQLNLDLFLAFLSGLGIAFGMSAGLLLVLDAPFLKLERSRTVWLAVIFFSMGSIFTYIVCGPSNLDQDMAQVLRSIR